MASLEFAGDNGSLSDINATQGEFRSQIAALTDMVKQIAGNAAVSAGNSAQADPLNAPFTLYVNPYIGSDEFVGGSYNDYETGASQQEIIESKLKRLEKQRLTCGFTPQRPFKTINRAVIEAAIITSKDWYTITDPAAHVDCVSIVLSTGVHTLYNDPGQASTSITSWGASKNPSTADLIKFNPATVGGVLLPRGCSLCGPDLRKTTIRPNWVPAVADEAADYSNRRGMLKITGTGYFFGFTVMDKIGLEASHHLLDAFHFASKSELDDFYAKTFSAVGSGADLGSALTVTRGTEYQIVGPIDRTQSPTSAWDTTSSASPYIFNCSIRSNYGIGGAFMDGSKVEGLKSMVCANFTGVSLQKDMDCWQRYSGGNWTTTTYEQYISTDPDNIRMNPARLSRHISAINDAFIQEVSVFAIGQGIHHFTDLGGEITVTNSNSSFGACAALSRGYKSFAFNQDQNWTVSKVKVPLNVSEKTGNIKRIYLGTVSAVTSTTVTLNTALATTEESASVPAILYNQDYSLREDTKIWVENPTGNDWRSDLEAAAWDSSSPDIINIKSQLIEAVSDNAVGTDNDGNSLAIGKRVYIRRLVDTRTPSERRVSLQLNNTASARIPQRNFTLQTDPDRVGGAIDRELTGDSETITVLYSGTGSTPGAGVSTTAEITLRRSAPSVLYANGTFYPAGAIVKYAGKHYQALESQTPSTSSPDPEKWGETFVHMPSAYNAEDSNTNNELIVVFDTDTSDEPASSTLGINFTTVWSSLSDDYAVAVRNRYRTSTDYLGTYALLLALGFSSSEAHAVLVPRAADSRELDPSSAVDFPDAPSGGAATGRGNWAIEFRRPSTLRLYGHAWEWAGFLNYSKAIPAAQKDLSAQNKFTYYFTNEAGGRVVPQGSNEDGFNITPRGLEDIETGLTVSVESIGSSTIDQATQTEFEEITIQDLTVTGSISYPAVGANSQTDRFGIVELADPAEMRTDRGTFETEAAAQTAINNDGKAVTPTGLSYWAVTAPFAPKLDDNSRRLFVKSDWSSLPAGASTYPLVDGSTYNLNNIPASKRFTSLAAAFQSLPLGFSLPENSQIEIYLLQSDFDEGEVSLSRQVGTSAGPTWIIPYDWSNANATQILRYSFPETFALSEGYFYNVAFLALNPADSAVPATRWDVRVDMPAGITTNEPTYTIIGENITFTNLKITINKNANASEKFRVIIFNGVRCDPYIEYESFQNNNSAIYFELVLTGSGTYVTSGGVDDINYYDLLVFRATSGNSIKYGAAMCDTTTLTGLGSDEDRRLATAYFQFINNTGAAKNILFHLFHENSTYAPDGAKFPGYTSNITWKLAGTAAWEWRLYGFIKGFDELDGDNAVNCNGFIPTRAVNTQSWGGFINSNSSTNAVTSAYSLGPFSQFDSDNPNWGVFGAHNSVADTASLIGADSLGYFLRSNFDRFNIVNGVGAQGFRVDENQYLLVGYTTSNGAYRLQVNSQIFATSGTIATSDARYKTNVQALNGCLDLIKSIRPVVFDWIPQEDVTYENELGETVVLRASHKFPSETQVGFIAQEVEQVFDGQPWGDSVIKESLLPAAVTPDGVELAPEEEFKGIAEGNMIAILTSALKEAVAKIESLEARVASLEGSN